MSAMAGGGHGSPASSGPSPQRTYINEQHMRFFAAALCGFLAIFIVAHWVRKLCVRPGSLPFTRPFATVTRCTRSFLVQKAPGFPSSGHALLVTAFAGLNVAVAAANVDSSSLGNYASRFGWVAVGNLCLLVFLALKNTPLAFLTAYSYERLNCLHQVAGFCMFLWMVLHAALYTVTFAQEHILQRLYAEQVQIFGIISGFAFLAAVFAAVVLRRFWYELFYVVHILGWIVGIVAMGFHQPDLGKTVLIATVLSASMWLLDRLIRGARILWNSVNNTATLYPLSDGGTKIVMAKTPSRAQSGKHCFIWIPSVRRFETHPFTIVSTSPNLEFVVRARSGFTRDLHKFAQDHPGVSIRASVDGPYGTFPDPRTFDKVILIAGGGGATFTFGLAGNILARVGDTSENNITFIWAVQKHENLSWFEDHLDNLKTHVHANKVKVDLYISRAPAAHTHTSHVLRTAPSNVSTSSGQSGASMWPVSTDPEKAAHPPHGPANRVEGGEDDKGEVPSLPQLGHQVSHTRPDIASLIRNAVQATPKDQRVLVAACGPTGLMRVARDTAAQLMAEDGPAVEFHCEQFGW